MRALLQADCHSTWSQIQISSEQIVHDINEEVSLTESILQDRFKSKTTAWHLHSKFENDVCMSECYCQHMQCQEWFQGLPAEILQLHVQDALKFISRFQVHAIVIADNQFKNNSIQLSINISLHAYPKLQRKLITLFNKNQ